MELSPSVKIWAKRIIPVVIGGIAGYAYYYYIGCLSGTCPISSNPWISTTYGAVMGYFIAPRRKKQVTETDTGANTPGQQNQ